jgi:hypothetical protein
MHLILNGTHVHRNPAGFLLTVPPASPEQTARMLSTLVAAIERSAFDVSPCGLCGQLVVCIPDGLPCCDPCAEREAGKPLNL